MVPAASNDEFAGLVTARACILARGIARSRRERLSCISDHSVAQRSQWFKQVSLDPLFPAAKILPAQRDLWGVRRSIVSRSGGVSGLAASLCDEGTVDDQTATIGGGVDHNDLDAAVAEELLKGGDTVTAFERVDGK